MFWPASSSLSPAALSSGREGEGRGREGECERGVWVRSPISKTSPLLLTLSATAASHWRSRSSLYMAPRLVANLPGEIFRLALLSFSYCADSCELVTKLASMTAHTLSSSRDFFATGGTASDVGVVRRERAAPSRSLVWRVNG